MPNEYPRWSGPLIGLGLGILVALGVSSRMSGQNELVWILGPAIGLAGGFLVLLLDSPSAKGGSARSSMESKSDSGPSAVRLPDRKPMDSTSHAHSSFSGRFLVLVAIVLWCVPVVGWGFCLVAVLSTRRDQGWPRIASWIAAGLAALECAFLACIYLMRLLE